MSRSRAIVPLPIVVACLLCGAGSADQPPEGWPSADAHPPAYALPPPALAGESVPDCRLTEIGGVRFPPPVLADSGVEVVDGEGLLYLGSREGTLAIVDASDGGLVDEVRVVPLGTGGANRLARIETSAGSRLLLESARRVLDITDPRSPVFVTEGPDCGSGALGLDGYDFALSWGSSCLKLWDLAGWRGAVDLGIRALGRPILGGAGGRAMVAVRTRQLGSNRVETWDVSNPVSPRLLALHPDFPFALDPTGEILVTWHAAAVADEIVLETRDAATGAVLGTLENLPSYARVDLALSAGRRVLIGNRLDAVDIYDLSDPRSPRSLGTIEIASGWGVPRRPGPVVVLRQRPWIVLGSSDPRGVVIADLDGDTLGFWAQDPQGLVIDVDVDEAETFGPVIFVQTLHADAFGQLVPGGGVAHLDVVSIASPGLPEMVASYRPISPRRIETWVPFAGRYAAVFDIETNALLTVDLTTGLPVTETGLGFYSRARQENAVLAVAGDLLLAGDRRTQEIFRIDGGALTRIEAVSTGGWAWQAVGADDGTLVLREQVGAGDRLSIRSADGLWTTFDPGFAAGRMELHPSGRALLLGPASVWSFGPQPVALVDLRDPAAPALVWRRDVPAQFANWVRGGSAIAITLGDLGRLQVQLLDGASGDFLGDPSPPVTKFFYHGPGVAVGAGDEAVMTYWAWTPLAWKTVVWNVGGDSPELRIETAEYLAEPVFAPRRHDGAWYELRENVWAPGSSAVLVGHPDGRYDDYGGCAINDPRPVRRGVLASTYGYFLDRPRDISVLHDPALALPVVIPVPSTP